jgi:branched-chain amino acid transport system permease protein
MDWNLVLRTSFEAAFGVDAVIYCLAAIGINLQFGYTGLLNFGQVGFMAVGAYSVGISVNYYHWPWWIGILIGLALSVVLALLLGVPTLRLRADYLAIVTIATGEIIRLIMRAAVLADFSGGSAGLPGDYRRPFFDLSPFDPTGEFPRNNLIGWLPRTLWLDWSGQDFWVMIVGWSLVGIVSFAMWQLIRSPWGRVLRAIREDEEAVRALGKNVYWYKMQSLMIGGGIGCLAGFMFAYAKGSVQPDNYSTAVTFFAYTALILGGTAKIKGPIVGAMILWFVIAFSNQVLRGAKAEGWISDNLMDGTQVGQVRFMIVGLGLMLLLIFRPQGIFGDKKELALDAR